MEYPVYTIIREYVDGEVFIMCRTTNEHYANFVLEDERQLLERNLPSHRRYPGAINTLTLKKDDDIKRVIHGFDQDNEVSR